MTKLFLYVVRACTQPDYAKQSKVPWRINEREIFFGPCKRPLRTMFHRDYLLDDRLEVAEPKDDVYIVGVNGANAKKVRKVVWAGRVEQVMTFAHAFRLYWARRNEPEVRFFLDYGYSPLHVEPIPKRGPLQGYRRRKTTRMHFNAEKSDLRKKHDWVMDFLANWEPSRLHGNRLLLGDQKDPWLAFPRDACIVLENRFYANGNGIPINNTCIELLKRTQIDRNPSKITSYAVFGEKGGGVDGRRGRHLQMDGEDAKDFVDWMENNKEDLRQKPFTLPSTSTHRRC